MFNNQYNCFLTSNYYSTVKETCVSGTLDKKEDLANIIVNINDVNDEPPMFEFDR